VALVLALAGCGSRTPSAADGFVAHGTWGGDHVSLAVDSARVGIEFDCAHGALPAPIALDGAGQFEVVGAFVLEHGGPVREGEEIVQHPARYSGTVEGGRMTLRVMLVDGSLDLGTYQLTFGAAPRLFKCL
jgi:hypothetical protein